MGSGSIFPAWLLLKENKLYDMSRSLAILPSPQAVFKKFTLWKVDQLNRTGLF